MIPVEEGNRRGGLGVPRRKMEESIYTKCGLEGVGVKVVDIYVHLVGKVAGRGGRGGGDGFRGSGPQGVRRSASTRA